MTEPGADEVGWLAATDGMEMMLAGWRYVGTRMLGCFFLACAEELLRGRPAADRSTAILPQLWVAVNGDVPWANRPRIDDQAEYDLLYQVVRQARGRSQRRVRSQSDIAMATTFLASAVGDHIWWSRRHDPAEIDPVLLPLMEAFYLRRERIVAEHGRLLRDIAGNPFRPVAFAPEWRTEAVAGLARGVYASRNFAPLPVLADALEDAGCADAGILAHCRGPGPHVRGCWVVDLVLGYR